MSDYNQHDRQPQAYTGETIVMPGRRRPAPPQITRPSRRRIWPIVRLALLGALALAILALLFLYLQIRSVAGQIVTRDARPNAPIVAPWQGFNLLLVGVDERPDHPGEGIRSDTLIVVHLTPAGRWANLLSIPRDTRVALRDLGEAKINLAYGYGYANAEALYSAGTTPQQGGLALAAETVEQFLGFSSRGERIHYVAQINFDGFARIVDALGGVTIDVPKPIVDEAYPTPDFGTRRVEFQAGPQRMDGATALIYARTRHADSDFGRAERQQQVIRAILDEVRRRGMLGQALLAPQLLGGLRGSVTTTLPIARPDMLVGLGWLASGLSPDEIGQFRITPESVPAYREEGSDLIWDPEGVRAVVSAFLTRPSQAAEVARVQVFNATSVNGLAGRVSSHLEREGFTVIPADNASTEAQRTVVYDVTNKPRTSQRLAQLLGAELRRGPPPEEIVSQADIVVVLGSDAPEF